MPRFLMATAVLMVRGRGIVDRTGVRFRTGHGQPENHRQCDPDAAHRPNYTALSFQRPRRNSTALATAKVENAIVTAQATPCGPRLKCRASSQASGISHNQKQNRFSHVGVQVSPAPLKEFVRTIP